MCITNYTVYKIFKSKEWYSSLTHIYSGECSHVQWSFHSHSPVKYLKINIYIYIYILIRQKICKDSEFFSTHKYVICKSCGSQTCYWAYKVYSSTTFMWNYSVHLQTLYVYIYIECRLLFIIYTKLFEVYVWLFL